MSAETEPLPGPPMSQRLMSRQSLMSSSVLMAETVVRIGMVAVVSLWIAHQLGPAQFGLLNHASALVGVFWAAALLGLDTPLTARLAVSGRAGLELGSAILLRTATGLLGGLLAVAAALMFRGDDTTSVLLTAIVALSVPLSAPFVLDAWFKASNEAVPPALARLVATALSCGAKVAGLLLGGGVVALAWTVALESLLVAAALYLTYRRHAPRTPSMRLVASRAQMASLMRECWPFLLSTFAIAAYMKIDVVLLGVLSTDEQTGLYSLSQKLCEVLYLVPVIVVDVLFPQLVRHHVQHGDGSVGHPQMFFDLAFAVALLATAVGIVCVVLALPTLFGEPYRPTVGIFVVQAWACLGIAMNHARFKWMAATGRQGLAPWVTLVGLLLAVAGHLLLIPRYGAMGAAVATVVAFLGSGWLCTYAFPSLRPAAGMQTRSIWPWGRLWAEWRSVAVARGGVA